MTYAVSDVDQCLAHTRSSRLTLLLYPARGASMQKLSYPLPIHGESAKFREMEARINQLEALAALQDETIAALSKELFRQQQDLTGLRQRIEALEKKMEQRAHPDKIAGNERPPHW